ncbi:SLC26A/SulP transporter family protein [Desulfatirhabdium butyrativorans]|uniref:SLC26A/SulP transporter family protein n=1 Tax=Desulfatirhabdium butyrativorans TaxID=340467 RepID=UPI00048417AA|nr:SulP family inorganic anion transporter [Desulfatirhabdium butyrativorans]
MKTSLLSELFSDITSGRIIPAASTAVVASIIFIIFELSFAAMIFSGNLSSLATRGASLALCGGILMCFFAALTSAFRSVVSQPQDAPAAVLSAIALAISASLGQQSTMEVKFINVAAALSLSSVLTGVVYILIGRFRLANMLRFIPFPVVGGFLAGTGWLFIAGGLAVMCDMPISIHTIPLMGSGNMMLKWLPGLIYGGILFAVTMRYSHFLIVPGSLAASVVLYYIAFSFCGVSADAARAAGLLVSGVPAKGLWPPFNLHDLSLIQWPLLLQQLPGMFSVVLITVIGMMLNSSGIELAVGKETDINREFVVGGMGNCLTSLGGCFPGYPSVSLTFLGLKTGVQSRFTGILTAFILGGVVVFGGRALEFFPKALLGGMLLFLGLSLIHEWIYEGRKRLPLPDYLILCAIFLVVGLFGFLQGVAVGLVASVIFFVIRFSGVSVIKSEFTARIRPSLKERPIPHRKLLSMKGDRIRAYELCGYIFFGSATTLMNSLKSALASKPTPDFIVLDFTHVSGFDISAVNNFHRFSISADAQHTFLVITAAPERFINALKHNLSPKAMANIAFFDHLDEGLEWCEDRLIEEKPVTDAEEASLRDMLFHQSVDDVMAHLQQQERFEYLVDRLAPWLENRVIPAGSTILAKGEQSPGLFLLTFGTATEMDSDQDVRARSLTQGSIIAAPAAFGQYAAPAAIRADSDCRLALLSAETRILLEQENPNLALELYGFLIQSG